ncbi:MAG: amino acid permease [Armatimonadetes bacterium]|nr:amino acid permease [Armatimonadota bacterium]
MEDEGQGELQRGLKPRHLQLIALGGIIGSAYFLGTGQLVLDIGPAAVVSFMLGGLLVWMVMVCLGELAAHIPSTGSFVQYANEYISPTWGCGVGWSYWINWVAYVPSEMIAAGLIMNNFVPSVPVFAWATLFGVIITALNLMYVGAFGEAEFWLALIKIIAIALFAVMAILIVFGLIGDHGFQGTSKLLGNGGFFPNGVSVIFFTMVLILVNFQGSEIIGIAAGESQDPAHSIPQTVKQVSYRIIAIYVIPVFLLVCILPWQEAQIGKSVFAIALSDYGFTWAGNLFLLVVLTAAISCSNSGLYATSRTIFALSKEGMAPEWLGRVNARGVPHNAILTSIAGCWVFIVAFALMSEEAQTQYLNLLIISGFTGGIAWVSICWSQLYFRRRIVAAGNEHLLKYKAPFFPWFTLVAIWAQVACLLGALFQPTLRMPAMIGVVLLILPMAGYQIWGKKRAC